MARKFFVGGNFKMNGSLETLTALLTQFNDATLDPNTEVVVAPPALYLIPLKEHARKEISIAAQNAHQLPSGAYTGEVSISQLKDINLPWVILGHSERRTIFHETDELIATKTEAAIKTGIDVIFCVGENLEERETGKTTEVVTRQLAAAKKVVEPAHWSKIVIAYEPVWAIGTGKVATPQQAQETHAAIRKYLADEISAEVAENTRIIYGGSVSAKNAKELATQPDIDGFLVGGASLKPEFVEIIKRSLSEPPFLMPVAQLSVVTYTISNHWLWYLPHPSGISQALRVTGRVFSHSLHHLRNPDIPSLGVVRSIVPVATLSAETSPALDSLIAATFDALLRVPVNNSDPWWNCQYHVFQGLDELRALECLSGDELDEAWRTLDLELGKGGFTTYVFGSDVVLPGLLAKAAVLRGSDEGRSLTV
ncbi:hypothetical protein MNV49_007224 [Pseudohyphozyma bogoriensis]|nr:hypothetical protein MNV49_007224 [Pseudohyphozyma bogoriensis]